ncbi:hypothetical protein OROHE_019514 [Orobanche hederae]
MIHLRRSKVNAIGGTVLTIEHSENKDKYLAMASSGREGLVWATTAILLIILMVDVDQMLGKKMVFLGTMGRVSKSSTPVVQKESNKNLLLQVR